jgi:plasmid stability protein
MPNLSIKDVPEALAEQLRQRAARNHRSLQGELMAILEATVQTPPAHVAEATAAAYAPAATAGRDDLLVRLDAVVAGSQWGNGPWLTREQIHDRRLMRELEYAQRQEEVAA